MNFGVKKFTVKKTPKKQNLMFECYNLLDSMDRKEFENFLSIFNCTLIFESWGSYARVSGNASSEDEKNKFGSFQLTYPDAMVVLVAPPFVLRSRPVHSSSPDPPFSPPVLLGLSLSFLLVLCVCF
jgi:hypothetical protein